MKMKFLTAVLCGIAVIALLAFSSCTGKNAKQLNTAKKVAIMHLDKKYNQKFAISKARYITQTDTYQLEAYPVGNTNFKFDVFMGGVAGEGISDQYMGTLHSLEATKIAQPYIDAIAKNNYCFATSGVDKNFDEINKYVYGLNPILTMQQIMNKYGKDICFNVYAYCALDITDHNKDQILKNTYKLYKFLKDKDIGRIMIQINFYPESLFKGMDPAAIYENLKNKLQHDKDCAYSIGINPLSKYSKKIDSYKDLNSCIYRPKEDKHGF